MKTLYALLLLFCLPVILGGQANTEPKDPVAKEVLELNKKLDAASVKLDLANKMLDIEQIETVVKSPKHKTLIKTITKNIYVPKYIFDTIYIRDTVRIFLHAPVYGGDSVQKANWKQNRDEGKFFKNILKRKKNAE